MKWPSQKLDHQKIRPFTIEEKIKQVNYCLKLPESIKWIHPQFHILLLKPAPKNTRTQRNIKIKSKDEYEVKRILNYKQVSGWPYYLVKWKGYDTLENTWEPIVHLDGCHQKIKWYHQQQKSWGSLRRKKKPSSATN